MEAARTTLQIVRVTMLFSIAIYAFIIKQLPTHARANPVIYYSVGLVAFSIFLGLFAFRQKLIKRSENVLASNPDDAVAQKDRIPANLCI